MQFRAMAGGALGRYLGRSAFGLLRRIGPIPDRFTTPLGKEKSRAQAQQHNDFGTHSNANNRMSGPPFGGGEPDGVSEPPATLVN